MSVRQNDIEWKGGMVAFKSNPLSSSTNIAALVSDHIVAVKLTAEATQRLFEQQFGVDQITRTRKQWKALVKQYGIAKVCELEKMNIKEVKNKCNK